MRYQVQYMHKDDFYSWEPSRNDTKGKACYASLDEALERAKSWQENSYLGHIYRVWDNEAGRVASNFPKVYMLEALVDWRCSWFSVDEFSELKEELIKTARKRHIKSGQSYRVVNTATGQVVYRVQRLTIRSGKSQSSTLG